MGYCSTDADIQCVFKNSNKKAHIGNNFKEVNNEFGFREGVGHLDTSG